MSDKSNATQAQHSIDLLKAFQEEWGKLEAKTTAQWNEAIDEAARLGHATLAYTTQLASAWRAMALETAKKTSDLFGVKG